MKKSIITLLVIVALNTHAQTDMKTLLNFPVGGTWTSENIKNDKKPNSFRAFYMQFETWSSPSSVLGSIYGVRNNGDTIQLMEVWNFLEPDEESAFLIQRTTWGDKSIGNVKRYEGEHLDITFKTTSSSGGVHFTRDIHFIVSKNEMKAKTYHKTSESDDWQFEGESTWKRINQ
ncbi:hypothetical protein [Ekhidna sp. To15]|uniref:hypothetical protein n=1 Tax=Ekhidna sp. To15 TaxID=3395267 RepID=UPI003F528DF3